MAVITTKKGIEILVDGDDYEWLTRYNWYIDNHGYAARSQYIRRRRQSNVKMHRAIMDPTDGLEVDHVDGNKLNNCKANLRLCTHAENLRNTPSHRNSSSRYKGVSWNKQAGKWKANIRVDGRLIHLGYFTSELAAGFKYDLAAFKHFGEFAKLNTDGFHTLMTTTPPEARA